MDGLSIRAYGTATGALLGDRPYYSSLGAGVAVRYLTLEDSIVEGAFEYRDRNFYNSVNYPLAAEQTGTLLSYGLGSTGKFTDNLGWLVRGAFEQNRADTVYSSYQRWSVDVGLPITFPVRVAAKVYHWVFTRAAGKIYRSRNEAKADVFVYIERFYNPKRRHSTIEYPSPMAFERRRDSLRRVSRKSGAGLQQQSFRHCERLTLKPAHGPPLC